MAKLKKTVEPEHVQQSEEPVVEENATVLVEEPVVNEQLEAPLYIPDIPAQMIVQEEKPESDEILFLRHILKRNHDGGFGHHLDDEILERIKYLKSCQ